MTTPTHTSCWKLTALLRDENSTRRAARASERVLNVAAGLEPGSHVSLIMAGDGAGKVVITLHTDSQVAEMADLVKWFSEDQGQWAAWPEDDLPHLADPADLGTLVELIPAIRAPLPPAGIVLEDPLAEPPAREPDLHPDLWPVAVYDDGMQLLQALAATEAQVRVHMAPTIPVERQMISALTRRSVQSRDPVHYSEYMGTPVRIRCFIGQRGHHLSPRLRAAVGRLGIGLHLADLDPADASARQAWDGATFTLAGSVQPFGVAQCFLRIPACGEVNVIAGIPTREAETPPVPLSAQSEPVTTGIRLGSATAEDGSAREVRVDTADLLLHAQVLGATGTGKSTLLAAMVQEAAALGIGVSVLDSHGPLIERIINELPTEAARRTIVVRSGDVDNPVPLNPLRNDDPELIAELVVQVLRELLDPRDQGFLGPRFERAFGLTLRAQRVLFGERANLAAQPYLFRTPPQVRQLAAAVRAADPELSQLLESEFARIAPDDFAELASWINAKYQRLVATPEMRAILSTGEDSVDVTRVIDERGILLIDLASPTIGPLGSQFLGEMWLTKHWAALAQRSFRRETHLLIVDEAHLFAAGTLPRLLAQARKFGIGVVLAHQSLEQLTDDLRQSTLATTSNVIVFRTGPHEAGSALSRLGAWSGGALTRLPRFQAATTLSQGATQTDAFTLAIDHNTRVRSRAGDESWQRHILRRTRDSHVEPYRNCPRINLEAVDRAVDDLASAKRPARPGARPDPQWSSGPPTATSPESPDPAPGSGSSFLDEWLAKRKTQQPPTGDQ